MILIEYLCRPCLVLLIACGVAMLALELSSTKLHLFECDGRQLFGELFILLVAKGGVGILGCLVAETRKRNKVRRQGWH